MAHVTTSSSDLSIAFGGDVMLGRGIDQVFARHNDPALYEGYVRSARDYVALAARANGEFGYPVSARYVWGDALDALANDPPDLRIVNLETAVTVADEPAPKGINYRMHPANLACLTAFGIDCCVLANNHVLDWGTTGLLETLERCAKAGLATAGAGRNRDQAMAPATLSVPGKSRLRLFAFALPTSGVPAAWAAGPNRPGVAWLDACSAERAADIAAHIERWRKPGDVIVVSLHWGPNWGYDVPAAQRAFAQTLIRAGVHVVYGHSSHHPKAVERCEGRPILYGCGDLLNDYEGIGGHDDYRPDLVLLYRVTLSGRDHTRSRVAMHPLRIRRFRLQAATAAEADWLQRRMDRECARFGPRVTLANDGVLQLTGDDDD